MQCIIFQSCYTSSLVSSSCRFILSFLGDFTAIFIAIFFIFLLSLRYKLLPDSESLSCHSFPESSPYSIFKPEKERFWKDLNDCPGELELFLSPDEQKFIPCVKLLWCRCTSLDLNQSSVLSSCNLLLKCFLIPLTSEGNTLRFKRKSLEGWWT